MSKRLNSERGSAIITAIAFMGAMLLVGLAAMAFADDQSSLSGKERKGESTFNLAEGLLDNQAFILSRGWPSSIRPTAPAFCTHATAVANPNYCPQPARLGEAFTQVDFANNDVTWTTEVHDDSPSPCGRTGQPDCSRFYDFNIINARPNWDENGNGRVWVRAQATLRRNGATDCVANTTGPKDLCRSRAIVALLEIEQFREEVPQRVIIAGKFTLTPNGNHHYVNTNPDATSPHNVTVRCSPPQTPNQSDPCMGFTPDRSRPQINPEGAYEQGFVGQDALPDEQKERLKERAISDGTYYTGCPTAAQLTGKVVWVANCAEGHYTKNFTWNSPVGPGLPGPGMLIWEDGLLELGGNSTFHGIVYHLNNSNSTDHVLELRGGLTIEGGAFVDGPGGIDVGSNKVNVNFDGNAFAFITTFGTAAVVQNSWREVRCEPFPNC